MHDINMRLKTYMYNITQNNENRFNFLPHKMPFFFQIRLTKIKEHEKID